MTHNTRTPQTVPVFAGYLVLGMGYGLRSIYMIYAMSDETVSITRSAEPPEGVDRGWFMFFITLLVQLVV